MWSEEDKGLIDWWFEQIQHITKGKSWNEMPEKMRNDLLEKLKLCIADLAVVNITKKDVEDLVSLGGIHALIDALLRTFWYPPQFKATKQRYINNIKQEIANNKIGKYNFPIEYHKEKKDKHRAKGKPVSLETVKKYDPLDFKRKFCRNCGKVLNGNNVTGFCRKCQRNGNGAKIEH